MQVEDVIEIGGKPYQIWEDQGLVYWLPLQGEWDYCTSCGRMFRLADDNDEGPAGSRSPKGDTWCWPCYDGFYDCCWGPGEERFQYVSPVPFTGQLPNLEELARFE